MSDEFTSGSCEEKNSKFIIELAVECISGSEVFHISFRSYSLKS